MTITVVTATYNRRRLLTRLFESLVEQRYDAIEWIIVDDGGADDSGEAVREFEKRANFKIRYVRQENGGKASAVNHGLDLVTGDLVTIIDDDDYFLPDVFAGIDRDFAEISESPVVAGLSYLSVDSTGQIWGRRFPKDHMISDHYECRINQNIWGDKCEFTKAKVFTEDKIRFYDNQSGFMLGGDTVFLMDIAKRYKTCYINNSVLVKNYFEDGIAVNWRRISLKNPATTALYYKAHLSQRLSLRVRLRYMGGYLAIEHYAGNKLRLPEVRAPWNRVLFCLAYFPGVIIGRRWRSYKNGKIPVAKHWLRSQAE